jgi:hypothetical protein
LAPEPPPPSPTDDALKLSWVVNQTFFVKS